MTMNPHAVYRKQLLVQREMLNSKELAAASLAKSRQWWDTDRFRSGSLASSTTRHIAGRGAGCSIEDPLSLRSVRSCAGRTLGPATGMLRRTGFGKHRPRRCSKCSVDTSQSTHSMQRPNPFSDQARSTQSHAETYAWHCYVLARFQSVHPGAAPA